MVKIQVGDYMGYVRGNQRGRTKWEYVGTNWMSKNKWGTVRGNWRGKITWDTQGLEG